MVDERTPALTLGVRGIVADRRRRAHRPARPPLGHVRRRGAQRRARAADDAGRGPARARRPAARRAARRHRAADRRRDRLVGDAPGRRARARGGRRPRPAPRCGARLLPRATGPTPRSTSTASRAATPRRCARSSRPRRARSSRSGLRRASARRMRAATLERLMRAAAPEAAEVTFTQYGTGEPAAFDPGTPALLLCREAIERGSGMPLGAGARRAARSACSRRSPTRASPAR